MWRQLHCVIPQTASIYARRNFVRPPWYWGSNPLAIVDKAMRDMDREFRQLEKSFGYPSFLSATRPWRPFIDEHPTEVEVYRVKNPIVEEDGVKKFKLEFDVRRFKPEDVKIKTNAKDRILQIEAKTADENSKFEYFRKVSIPEGVQPTELTCKFKGDGVLEFEAPYTEPAKVELPKDTILEIKHE